MSSCTRRAPVRVICENLEPRRLFAMQVFFQDFDKPDDDWQTGPNRFIEPGGAAAGARREVAESGNVLDFRYLRGNWAQNVTDEVIGDPPTPSNLRSRFTNVAIGVASRGLSEFYLNHWVWFDAGVENFEDENIKFVQFDGGDVVATDFDWFVDLNGNNFDTYHLRNNSNGNVGGPDSAGVKFSDLPGARELMGNMSPANWFRGRWHNVQVYVKLNTADNLRNGIFRFWLDGIKVFDLANVDYRNSTSDTLRKVLPLSMHGGNHSPPGSFGWQLDEVELWDGLPTGAPRVNRVFVRGRDWAPALLNHIADRALGDRDFGYQIGEGAAQLDELPWTNVNQIAIRFDNVTQVGRADLRVLGVNVAAREITGFRYDGRTRTAQWTLRNPVSADRLTLALNTTRVNRAGSLLDGEWADGSDAYPSGNGSPGGAFNFRLNVLPGDATRDGRVNALDVAEVKRRLGRRPNDGASGYSIFADVTADGVINALDLAAIKQRLGRNLPVGSAAAATSVLLRDERVQSEMERIACFVPVA